MFNKINTVGYFVLEISNTVYLLDVSMSCYESVYICHLSLKAPITTAEDDIHKYVFIVFQRKIRLDVLSESSARQRTHMKNQAIFSSKDISKKIKCRLLQFFFGAFIFKHFVQPQLLFVCHTLSVP